MKSLSITCCLLASLLLIACSGRSAYTRPERNIQLAEQLYQKAVDRLPAEEPDDQEKVKALLVQAIEADLYHGAAHNNLGVILLQEGKLYDAAQEFEWARKLLPGHPDPRNNLAIALHRGGKVNDALQACDSALEVQPQYLPAIQSKTLIALRNGVEFPELDDYLGIVEQRGETEAWRSWAKGQRIKRASQL